MKHHIEFASHPANLSLVRDLVRKFSAECGFETKQSDLLVLGVDEACTNVIRHVYKHEETHLMALSCECVTGGVCFRVRDYGEQTETPLPRRALDEVQPGGLGLHLIKSVFDEVDYVLKERGTELVLTKKLCDRADGHAASAHR